MITATVRDGRFVAAPQVLGFATALFRLPSVPFSSFVLLNDQLRIFTMQASFQKPEGLHAEICILMRSIFAVLCAFSLSGSLWFTKKWIRVRRRGWGGKAELDWHPS